MAISVEEGMKRIEAVMGAEPNRGTPNFRDLRLVAMTILEIVGGVPALPQPQPTKADLGGVEQHRRLPARPKQGPAPARDVNPQLAAAQAAAAQARPAPAAAVAQAKPAPVVAQAKPAPVTTVATKPAAVRAKANPVAARAAPAAPQTSAVNKPPVPGHHHGAAPTANQNPSIKGA